jgi:hypothetical protein
LISLRRELVLADEGVDPNALLVDAAPAIQYAWTHRLLDPLKLQLLDPQQTKLPLVAQSDAVVVFAVPPAIRRAIVGLASDDPAWAAWLDREELRLDRATDFEARELQDVFKRAALTSALADVDAFVRVWFRSLGDG